MEEDGKYSWEQDPTKYLEHRINEAEIAKVGLERKQDKQLQFAMLNELNRLAKVKQPTIRYLVLVLDLSASLLKNDFPPTRLAALSKHVEGFLRHFFHDNPLSRVAVTATRDAQATVLSDFGSSQEQHVRTHVRG